MIQITAVLLFQQLHLFSRIKEVLLQLNLPILDEMESSSKCRYNIRISYKKKQAIFYPFSLLNGNHCLCNGN